MATSSPTVKWPSRAAGLREHGAQRVLLEIEQAAPEIGAAFAQGVLDDHRIEPGKVGRRDGVERLPAHEGDARGAFRRHAADRSRRASPPFLLREERLLPEDEGDALPGLVFEPPVPFGGDERSLVSRSLGGGVEREAGKASRRVQGEKRKLHLPARRPGEMRGPFEPGGELGMRGNALGEARQSRARQPVDRLEGRPFRRRQSSIVARFGRCRILARCRTGGDERALIHRLGFAKSQGARLASGQMGARRPCTMLPNRGEALVMVLQQIAANDAVVGSSRPGLRPS